jgi:predicted GIY-YIG superfamily endonuclease
MAVDSGEVGIVYLLHLHAPLGHARHYIGWSSSLDRRLAHHLAGSGARMLAIARQRGITWELARTWPGSTRKREAQLKRKGGASRMCPLCGVKPAGYRHPKAVP